MPRISDTTERPRQLGLITRENTGSSLRPADVDRALHQLSALQSATHILHIFSRCAEATGGYVQLRPEHRFFPVLIGKENAVTPLYEFVEMLDEVLDYDLVLKELPTLSYSHIGGAIAFLRRLAQSNPTNIDIDELEDKALSSPAFIEDLRTALADKETSRVLDRS